MKVKVLVSRVGVEPNGVEFAHSPGQVISLSRRDGQRLIDAAQAEFVELSAEEIAEDEAKAKAAEAKAEPPKKKPESKAADAKP